MYEQSDKKRVSSRVCANFSFTQSNRIPVTLSVWSLDRKLSTSVARRSSCRFGTLLDKNASGNSRLLLRCHVWQSLHFLKMTFFKEISVNLHYAILNWANVESRGLFQMWGNLLPINDRTAKKRRTALCSIHGLVADYFDISMPQRCWCWKLTTSTKKSIFWNVHHHQPPPPPHHHHHQ